MDFNVQPERGKSSREPRPRRPHYHESRPSKNQARRKTHLQLLAGSLSTLGSLLWEEVYERISIDEISRNGILTLVNVGQYTSLCDCDVSQKLVQFLVVADGELEMARDDTGLLVVAGSVTS